VRCCGIIAPSSFNPYTFDRFPSCASCLHASVCPMNTRLAILNEESSQLLLNLELDQTRRESWLDQSRNYILLPSHSFLSPLASNSSSPLQQRGRLLLPNRISWSSCYDSIDRHNAGSDILSAVGNIWHSASGIQPRRLVSPRRISRQQTVRLASKPQHPPLPLPSAIIAKHGQSTIQEQRPRCRKRWLERPRLRSIPLLRSFRHQRVLSFTSKPAALQDTRQWKV